MSEKSTPLAGNEQIKLSFSDIQTRPVMIPDFPGYRIGIDGSVWSTRDTAKKGRGEWKQKFPTPNSFGYLTVGLYCRQKKKGVFVHRLVLEAFVGPCPEGMQACHNDGNKLNNSAENLRWDTPKANVADRIGHGTDLRGVDHPLARLTEDQVREIYCGYESGDYFANKYLMTRATIDSIRKGKNWRHITKGLKKPHKYESKADFFNENMVVNILLSDASQRTLAICHGCDQSSITNLKKGKIKKWRHLYEAWLRGEL